MQKKLSVFFSQTTCEGPRYDTYVLYYSGPVTGKGDWALTGKIKKTVFFFLFRFILCNDLSFFRQRRCNVRQNCRTLER